jgi:hypothetical protein
MLTPVKCYPKHLQLGDRILLKNHTYIITSISGPDKIGTYDLQLIDDYNNVRMEIVIEPVTILM